MKTRCLIVDDEPLAVKVIQSYIKNVPFLEVVGTCKNAMKALEFLNENEVDLMFLDIQMPTMKGTDFLQSLKNPPKVVFTTAFREYALTGFDLDVLDYLLKPISFERFMQAINKYTNSVQNYTPNNIVATSQNSENIYINVQSNRQIERILIDDIIYIEGMKDYIKVIAKSKNTITNTPMYKILEKLPLTRFFQIHKSYIVNINYISAFNNDFIMIDSKELPLGRHYKKDVLDRLNG